VAIADPPRHQSWEGPLFVVGMPRSGTKLLRGLLTQHPIIRIPDFETEFLPYLVRWVREQGEPRDPEAFARMYAGLKDAPYFSFRASRGEPFSPDAWREWCADRFDAAGMFEGFARYELGMPRGSGKVWGDKSPNYITCVDVLLEHFPQAHIVHIVRDPRDYCVSMRTAWGKDLRRAAQRWGNDVMAAHRLCTTSKRRCLEIRYEDLLRDAEGQLARLCNFLGVMYTPGLAQLKCSVENVGDARGRAEIVKHNHSKFRSSLSKRDQKAIEELAYDTMREFGYEPELAKQQTRLSGMSLAYRRAKDGWHLVRKGAARGGWLRALRFHVQHQVVSKS